MSCAPTFHTRFRSLQYITLQFKPVRPGVVPPSTPPLPAPHYSVRHPALAMPDTFRIVNSGREGINDPPTNPPEANERQETPASVHPGPPAPAKQTDQMRVMVAGESGLGKASFSARYRMLAAQRWGDVIVVLSCSDKDRGNQCKISWTFKNQGYSSQSTPSFEEGPLHSITCKMRVDYHVRMQAGRTNRTRTVSRVEVMPSHPATSTTQRNRLFFLCVFWIRNCLQAQNHAFWVGCESVYRLAELLSNCCCRR